MSAQLTPERSVALPPQAPAAADKVQPKDSLHVTVSGWADLTRKYIVEPDGVLIFPLVGSVPAVGLTAQQLATELQRRLGQYLKDVAVRVAITRPERVFIFGESIKSPGTYPLESNRTLLQALAGAGLGEVSEAIVIRTNGAISPVFPGQDSASEVIRVNLWDLDRDIERGKLSGNIELKNGDTIFVPRVDPNAVNVLGQVRRPGVYAIARGTTVLQGLTLAGGPTVRASVGRASITRVAGGELTIFRATLADRLQPGDSVNVPALYSFPVVAATQTDLSTQSPNIWDHPPGELRLRPSFSLLPSFVIRRVGVDANLRASTGTVERQFGASLGPQLDALLRLDQFRFRAAGTLDYSYYLGDWNGGDSVNPGAGLSSEYAFSRRLTVSGSWLVSRSHDYLGIQLDTRARRLDHAGSVSIRVRPLDRLTFAASGQMSDSTLEDSAIFFGTSLRDTLSERIQGLVASAAYNLTSKTSIGLEAAAATHRFPFYPAKNADALEFAVVTTFRPAHKIAGTIRAGYHRYLALDPSVGSFAGPIGTLDLSSPVLEKTLVGARAERQTGQVWQRQFAYSVNDRYGAYIRQGLPAAFDARFEAYREVYHHQAFLPTASTPSDQANRYLAEIGRTVTRVGRVYVTAEYLQYRLPGSGLPGYSTLRWWGGTSFGVTRGALTLANLQAGFGQR